VSGLNKALASRVKSPPQPSPATPTVSPRPYEPGPRTRHGRRLAHGTHPPSGRSPPPAAAGPTHAPPEAGCWWWRWQSKAGGRPDQSTTTGGWLLKRAGHAQAGNSGPAHRLSVPPSPSPYPPGTNPVRRLPSPPLPVLLLQTPGSLSLFYKAQSSPVPLPLPVPQQPNATDLLGLRSSLQHPASQP